MNVLVSLISAEKIFLNKIPQTCKQLVTKGNNSNKEKCKFCDSFRIISKNKNLKFSFLKLKFID